MRKRFKLKKSISKKIFRNSVDQIHKFNKQGSSNSLKRGGHRM